MILELTSEERDALVSLVQREISDLGPEIRHTMTADYREQLKRDRQLLMRLLERLQAPMTV